MASAMELFLLATFCFFLRALPRILRPDAPAYDTSFHLYGASAIRANKLRIPAHYPRLYFALPYDYPFLYHWLLALFPNGSRKYAERFSPAMFDTLILVTIYIFSTWLNTWHEILSKLPLYASLVFCFQPALLRYDSGPRIHYGSPRVLGQLLYVVHIVTAWYAWQTSNAAVLLFSIACAALIFVTAKFAVQVLVFFALPICIFIHPGYIILLLIAFGVILCVTHGKAFAIVRASIQHSIYYISLQKHYVWPVHVTCADYCKNFYKKIRQVIHFDCSIAQYIYTNKNPLNTFIFLYPEFFPSMILSCLIAPQEGLYVVVIFASCGALCTLITEHKPFMFLGEGERYMQYAAPFLSIIFSAYFGREHTYFIVAYCLYGMAFFICGMYLFMRDVDNSYKIDKSCHAFFQQLSCLQDGNILPIGRHEWNLALHTNKKIICGGVNVNVDVLDNVDLMIFFENYPYHGANFIDIVKRYNVAYVVTTERDLHKYLTESIIDKRMFFDRCELLLEGAYWQAYKVS